MPAPAPPPPAPTRRPRHRHRRRPHRRRRRPPPPPPAPTEAELFARMSLEQLNAQKPLEDVYFALRQVGPERRGAQASLQKDADWMKKWTSTRVTVEGHADSRGTSEYNLALGERRAAAVRDYLVSLGVDMARVNVVSARARSSRCAREENEACWSQNRRGHFVITAK